MTSISSVIPAEIAEQMNDRGDMTNDERVNDERVAEMDLKAEKMRRLLHDPNAVWEALGVEGMEGIYPDHLQNIGRLDPESRGIALKTRCAIDEYEAMQIGRAFHAGDRRAFSDMIWRRFEAYFKYLSELED